MPLTDAQIRQMGTDLATSGASDEQLRAFIDKAKSEQTTTPAPRVSSGPMTFGDKLQLAASVTQLPAGGSPVALAQAAYEAGPEAAGATAGQIIGSPAAELGGVQVGGAIGGALGNGVTQLRHMASGDQQGFQPGQMAGAAITGAVPGASLAKAGAGGVVKAGLKYGTANLAAKAAETYIDQSRMPTGTEAAIAITSGAVAAPMQKYIEGGRIVPGTPEANAALASVRDQTLKDARAAGYVIPGSRVNPSNMNSVIESMAGKAAIGQEATVRNQKVTNALARKAIGLPRDEAITPTAIQNVRDEAGKAYQTVAELSPQASETLQTLTQTRADAAGHYKQYSRSLDPSVLKQAQAETGQANLLEAKLEDFAVAAEKPGLVKSMRSARVTIAKSYQIENALNAADGNVDAGIIGKSFDKGNPLTDELAVIGRFQQAFPAYARPVATTPSAGVGKTKIIASLALGAEGARVAGPYGAAAGAVLPFLDTTARGAALSGLGQRFLASPSYGVSRADAVANFGRFLTTTIGRQNDPSLDADPLLNNGR